MHATPLMMDAHRDQQTSLDRWTGPVMFWLTVVWLALVGVGLHLLVDQTAAAADSAEGARAFEADLPQGRFHTAAVTCLLTAAGLFPVFWGEWLWHRWRGGRGGRCDWLALLLPALRIGGRDHVTGETQWLPGLGWVTATETLEARLERQLSVPMLVVALLVLPVIAVEQLWADQIAADARLGLATQLAGAAIWLAFAVEFLVLISIVPDRWAFVRRHWLDLAIICLPLIAFLRVLRVGRLGRLLRLNQLTKVSRTAKAFRMKGLALRVWRALLLLEVVDRVLQRDDLKRLENLQQKLMTAEREVRALRDEIARLETRIVERERSTQHADGPLT